MPLRGKAPTSMDQRLSLITLGVEDVERSRKFYEALGWEGRSPDGDVVFFQAGGMIVALWDREKLAEDSGVSDPGGSSGFTLALQRALARRSGRDRGRGPRRGRHRHARAG